MKLLGSLASGVAVWLSVVGAAEAAQPPPQGETVRTCSERSTAQHAEIIADCTAQIARATQLSERELGLAHFVRGWSFYATGRYDSALADAAFAVRASPRAGGAHVLLGRIYAKQNNMEAARQSALTAMEVDPRSYRQAAPLLIEVYELMNRHETALEFAELFVQNFPENPTANNQICWILAARLNRDVPRARQHCDAAIRLAPENDAYWDSRGMVGLREGRYADAWNDYDRAAKLAPGTASYLFGRGYAAIHSGRVPAGEADLAAARRIDPTIDATYAGYSLFWPSSVQQAGAAPPTAIRGQSSTGGATRPAGSEEASRRTRSPATPQNREYILCQTEAYDAKQYHFATFTGSTDPAALERYSYEMQAGVEQALGQFTYDNWCRVSDSQEGVQAHIHRVRTTLRSRADGFSVVVSDWRPRGGLEAQQAAAEILELLLTRLRGDFTLTDSIEPAALQRLRDNGTLFAMGDLLEELAMRHATRLLSQRGSTWVFATLHDGGVVEWTMTLNGRRASGLTHRRVTLPATLHRRSDPSRPEVLPAPTVFPGVQ